MRLHIAYPQGGGFEVEGEDADDLELLANLALKILWGLNTKPLTLEDMERWLGWDKR